MTEILQCTLMRAAAINTPPAFAIPSPSAMAAREESRPRLGA
jgi:hypothetical protein